MNDALDQLIEDNVTLLRQGRELIEDLPSTAYAEGRDDLGLSGIGPHIRHVTDFYLRFLGAYDAEPEGGQARRVDYDARARDPRTETDPEHALEVLATIMVRLRRLPERLERLQGQALEVRGDDSSWMPSTAPRELLSLLGHTIHHFALMAVLVRAGGGAPPQGFGVAPSTLRHWADQRAAAAEGVGACAR